MVDTPASQPIPHPRRPMIAVCGSSAEDALSNTLAEEVGRLLATHGETVICGGGPGVMAAACRGALSAGGVTVGIMAGDTTVDANPYVQIAVATGMSHARNAIIVQSADVVIAVGGAYGTLSEIALARACGRPVIGLETWVLNDPRHPDTLILATTPAEAVERALRLAEQAR
ncbi:TIGR00725 family protein [Candidatus Oscillochloris fontis]|uniref:TIGR00725 family protein n=1 Tax=Candidatus Oscillochloris fontis TaxID=2496868 RepID=UPI001931080F|nr:TIGR00725 family protein [Candidatus Oscillochloris fontis]